MPLPRLRSFLFWSAGLIGGALLVAGCTSTRNTDAPPAPPAPPTWEEGTPVRELYHVQVATTHRKDAASDSLSALLQWWNTLPSEHRPQGFVQRDTLPTAIEWKSPYYRVRIGPFLDPERAKRVLRAAVLAFPRAIIAREAVPQRSSF